MYLAETTSDLSVERDQIRRELQARGHTILPDRPLPFSGPDMENVVRDALNRCTLAIHPIGEFYGIVPELADRSIVELQHALSAEYSRQHANFSRLIWLPTDLQVREPRQEAFIHALQNEPLQPGDDLLQTSLEALKSAVQDKLASSSGAEEERMRDPDLTRIYLICDQRDLDDIEPLEDYLYDQRFEILRPLFAGDEAEVMTAIETFRQPGCSFLMPPVSIPLNADSVMDISHESLMRVWEWLKVWVEEEAQSARMYRRLAETTILHQMAQEGLWRDPALQLALNWRDQNEPSAAWAVRYHPAFEPAMQFLEKSREARQDELADEPRKLNASRTWKKREQWPRNGLSGSPCGRKPHDACAGGRCCWRCSCSSLWVPQGSR